MRFGVLGPLEIRGDDGASVAVSAAMQRTLLAALLLRANVTISLDGLIDVLWDGGAPSSARPTVLNYVARLRRTLGPEIGARLRTSATGYVVDVADESEVDYLLAGALERQARDAARRGDWAQAHRLVRQALGLWRGELLEDVPAARLHWEYAPVLGSARLRTQQLGIDASLYLGDWERAAIEVRMLIRAHPFRENLHERLLVALSCSGQRAEALSAFAQAQRLLREELGVDPASRLRALHQLVLDGAPASALLEAMLGDPAAAR
jgi:DNA-binding SARP family transcriptional activator